MTIEVYQRNFYSPSSTNVEGSLGYRGRDCKQSVDSIVNQPRLFNISTCSMSELINKLDSTKYKSMNVLEELEGCLSKTIHS